MMSSNHSIAASTCTASATTISSPPSSKTTGVGGSKPNYYYKKKVFLSISSTTTEQQLWLLLMKNQCGIINNVTVPIHRVSGDNKGIAFIHFRWHEDAVKFIERMDGYKLNGMILHPTWARSRRPSSSSPQKSPRRMHHQHRSPSKSVNTTTTNDTNDNDSEDAASPPKKNKKKNKGSATKGKKSPKNYYQRGRFNMNKNLHRDHDDCWSLSVQESTTETTTIFENEEWDHSSYGQSSPASRGWERHDFGDTAIDIDSDDKDNDDDNEEGWTKVTHKKIHWSEKPVGLVYWKGKLLL